MRRMMASSFGKMPTTSVRRLISPFSRSSGFVLVHLAAMALREVHVGEHVGFGVVEQRGELADARGECRV